MCEIFLQFVIDSQIRVRLISDFCWFALTRLELSFTFLLLLTCVDSFRTRVDSCWLVLIRVGLVLIRVELGWYSCIRIELIAFFQGYSQNTCSHPFFQQYCTLFWRSFLQPSNFSNVLYFCVFQNTSNREKASYQSRYIFRGALIILK